MIMIKNILPILRAPQFLTRLWASTLTPQQKISLRYGKNIESGPAWLTGFGFTDKNSLKTDLTETDEGQHLYPVIKRLGLETIDGSHHIKLTPKEVIQFIKIGSINKALALQYCLYLADLTKGTSEKQTASGFAESCYELFKYLDLNHKDLPSSNFSILIGKVAGSGPDNCRRICDLYLERRSAENSKCWGLVTTKVLASVYQFGLWDIAQKLIQAGLIGEINILIWDPLILSLHKEAKAYKNNQTEEGGRLKRLIWDHLIDLFNICQREGVKIITKHPLKLSQALDDFGFKVIKQPEINEYGRCTACNNELPKFEKSAIAILNETVRTIMLKSAEEGILDYSNPDEVARFRLFLDDLEKFDPRPIDCVIDGLNVSFRNASQSANLINLKHGGNRWVPNYGSLVETFKTTLIKNNLLKKYKKILVIGRDHMCRWTNLLDFLHENKIHYFLAKNDSRDDLFQLYAATLHPKTILISNDFFREYVQYAEGDARISFIRWLDTHQTCLMKNLKIIYPTPMEKLPSSNRSRTCLHAPVLDKDKLKVSDAHGPKNDPFWLCCTNTDLVGQKNDRSGKDAQ